MATALPFASAGQAVGDAARVFANRSIHLTAMAGPVDAIWSDLPMVVDGSIMASRSRAVTAMVWIADLGGYTPEQGDEVVSGSDTYRIYDVERHLHTGQYLLTMEADA